jgi:hypothetical protein
MTVTASPVARSQPGHTTPLVPQLRPWPATEQAVWRRVEIGQKGTRRWLDHVAGLNGCVRPVRLTGQLHTVDKTTGQILATRHTHELPDGVVYVPCGDRRASVCPPCSETYRADTYQLIKAGLVGGKGIPDTVRDHPAVFVTLTAPSFGSVHGRSINSANGKIRPCRIRRKIELCPHGRLTSCAQRHSENSPCLGRPLCLDCYDYSHHVVWNTFSGELWRRTIITLNRDLTKLGKQYGVKLRASYGKVAEYQQRGTVHFHGLIRIDQRDPDDSDAILAPPVVITSQLLATLVEHAVTATGFDTPPYPGTDHTWPIIWGQQIDIRPISGLDDGAISPEAVAAYLAKYATKATEPAGLPTTSRLTEEAAQHYADPDTHLGRLIAYCWELGDIPESLWLTHLEWLATNNDTDAAELSPLEWWKKTYGRLRRWAHMLGFGGHFATKSRRYSTTHKQLRAERREYKTSQRRNRYQRWDHTHYDDDTTLIVTDLTMDGIGYHNTADAALAIAAAAQAREQRQITKEERRIAN